MKLFITLTLLLITSISSAQEEITFNNLQTQSKDILATKTVSGIALSSYPFRPFNIGYPGRINGSIEFSADYFHENRLSGNWTLYKSIGLSQSFLRIEESAGFPVAYSTGKILTMYQMHVEAQLEPRWYFDNRLRYRHNKSTLNNTGWFLAAPLSLDVPLLLEPHAGSYNQSWIPDKFNLHSNLYLTLGYRQALTKHFMVEASAQQLIIHSLLYDGHTDIHAFSRSPYAPSYRIEIKAAYCF